MPKPRKPSGAQAWAQGLTPKRVNTRGGAQEDNYPGLHSLRNFGRASSTSGRGPNIIFLDETGLGGPVSGRVYSMSKGEEVQFNKSGDAFFNYGNKAPHLVIRGSTTSGRRSPEAPEEPTHPRYAELTAKCAEMFAMGAPRAIPRFPDRAVALNGKFYVLRRTASKEDVAALADDIVTLLQRMYAVEADDYAVRVAKRAVIYRLEQVATVSSNYKNFPGQSEPVSINEVSIDLLRCNLDPGNDLTPVPVDDANRGQVEPEREVDPEVVESKNESNEGEKEVESVAAAAGDRSAVGRQKSAAGVDGSTETHGPLPNRGIKVFGKFYSLKEGATWQDIEEFGKLFIKCGTYEMTYEERTRLPEWTEAMDKLNSFAVEVDETDEIYEIARGKKASNSGSGELNKAEVSAAVLQKRTASFANQLMSIAAQKEREIAVGGKHYALHANPVRADIDAFASAFVAYEKRFALLHIRSGPKQPEWSGVIEKLVVVADAIHQPKEAEPAAVESKDGSNENEKEVESKAVVLNVESNEDEEYEEVDNFNPHDIKCKCVIS